MSHIPSATWIERIRCGFRVAVQCGWAGAGMRIGLELARQHVFPPRGRATLLRAHALTSPGKLAFISPAGALTWAELDDRVDRLALGLRGRFGFSPEHTLMIGSASAKEIYEVDRALAWLGARNALTGDGPNPDGLLSTARRVGARVLIADGCIRRATAAGRGRPDAALEVGYEALLASASPGALPWTPVHTHRARATARTCLAALEKWPVRPADRHLPACPTASGPAFQVVSLTLGLGGTVVLVDSDLDPMRFLTAVQEHRITTTTMTPSLLREVIDLSATFRADYDISSLRLIFSADGSFSDSLVQRTSQAFGHVFARP